MVVPSSGVLKGQCSPPEYELTEHHPRTDRETLLLCSQDHSLFGIGGWGWMEAKGQKIWIQHYSSRKGMSVFFFF